MNIQIEDWIFEVDVESTYSRTLHNSNDHCECGYCRNYYECIDMVYPHLRGFLSQFGVVLEGPSKLIPFQPTYLLACYRIQGRILNWGQTALYTDKIPVAVEIQNNDSFLLWIGEMLLPWCLEEPVEDVVSPANTFEFFARMQEIWYLRHSDEFIFS